MTEFVKKVSEKIYAMQKLTSKLETLEEIKDAVKGNGDSFDLTITAFRGSNGNVYDLSVFTDSQDIMQTINALLKQQLDEKIESLKAELSKESNVAINEPPKEESTT